MAKETITVDEYFKLRGLFELSKDYNRAIKRIERIASEILEEPDDGTGYFGLISDNVFDTSPDIDGLLSDLGVKVVQVEAGEQSDEQSS